MKLWHYYQTSRGRHPSHVRHREMPGFHGERQLRYAMAIALQSHVQRSLTCIVRLVHICLCAQQSLPQCEPPVANQILKR